MKFDVILIICLENSSFVIRVFKKIATTLHGDQYTFLILSRSILLELEMF